MIVERSGGSEGDADIEEDEEMDMTGGPVEGDTVVEKTLEDGSGDGLEATSEAALPSFRTFGVATAIALLLMTCHEF